MPSDRAGEAGTVDDVLTGYHAMTRDLTIENERLKAALRKGWTWGQYEYAERQRTDRQGHSQADLSHGDVAGVPTSQPDDAIGPDNAP